MTTDTKTQDVNLVLSLIASEHLFIDTLETQRSDSLDFHDVAVWNVRSALEAAFRAGQVMALSLTDAQDRV